MRSPSDLAARWLRQWHVPDTREQRLLHADAWPITLPIGRPTAAEFVGQIAQVRLHIEAWRAVTVGEVVWRPTSFRGGTDPVDIPFEWKLNDAAEWVDATGDPIALQEYRFLKRVLADTAPEFHRTLVRQSSMWAEKTETEVTQVAEIAAALSAGFASGRPLRALSLGGTDTKFLERHRVLLIALLDARFEGQVGDLGLEAFLGAPEDNDHWLLVVPLDPELLCFERQKVRARELLSQPIPGTHLLLVENDSSLYQLPTLSGTVAILGSGLHLDWLRAAWLVGKSIGYWGDLDTWGLVMLATARRHRPDLQPILMSRDIFDAFVSAAVSEPTPAAEQPPDHLTLEEQALYRYLRELPKGRLEQEFLPTTRVTQEIRRWHSAWGPDH